MYVVADTNTLISGLLKPQSIPDQALIRAANLGILVFSSETKDEFLDVVGRKKFDKYLGHAERLKKAMSLLDKAEVVHLNFNEPIQCRDASDVKFLKLALQTRAGCIISGDIHLTELHPLRGIPILKPSEFLKTF